jgi:hypothetical protein
MISYYNLQKGIVRNTILPVRDVGNHLSIIECLHGSKKTISKLEPGLLICNELIEQVEMSLEVSMQWCRD